MAAENRHTKKSKTHVRSPAALMPGYGLPESNKGLLPWKWADQRLKKSHNYWITTVKPEAPHTMVVWGLWLDGSFLFSTGRQSRKPGTWPKIEMRGLYRAGNEAVIVEGIAVSPIFRSAANF